MESIDPGKIQKAFQNAAKYYIHDIFKDLIPPYVRSVFERHLAMVGLDDAIELSQDPAAFLVQQVPGTERLLFNEGTHELIRVVGQRKVFDIDEVRSGKIDIATEIEHMIGEYTAAMKNIELRDDIMRRPITHASVPAVFVEVKAFMGDMFLWGYIGRPEST